MTKLEALEFQPVFRQFAPEPCRRLGNRSHRTRSSNLVSKLGSTVLGCDTKGPFVTSSEITSTMLISKVAEFSILKNHDY